MFLLQVGETDDDHSRCLRAEQDKGVTKRTTWTINSRRPGADLLAEAAAAFAAAAIAYKDESYKDILRGRCEKAAKDLFRDALTKKGIYSDSLPECKKTYPSDGFETHVFYAAAMLCKMTGDSKYKKV
jgi:endoglucanase